MEPRIRIRLLGPVAVEVDGSPLDVDTRKAVALLSYLAVGRRPASRESLAALLWPEADSSDARGALRITLGNLPESATPPSVSAYDPLLKSATPARLVSSAGRSAVFEVAASDYPRMLSITYSGAVH